MQASTTLDLAPDVFAIARYLSECPDLAVLVDTTGASPSYVACHALEVSRETDPEPELPMWASPEPSLPRWIGVLPYECARGREHAVAQDLRSSPLVASPEWRRYGAVVEVGREVRVLGSSAASVHRLVERLVTRSKSASLETESITKVGAGDMELGEPGAAHLERIRRAQDHIARGEIYQVNLARRLRFHLEGAPHDVLARLLTRTDGAFSVALSLSEADVVATSPELFLSLDASGRARSIPIKGTRPRGNDEGEDAALREELEHDPKEQAELAMVVDVVRNDLGKVAVPGSVSVDMPFEVEALRTVFHRQARVSAQLRPAATRQQLFEAMLPSGSVTGAPKLRAMELIAKLESHRRGLYTGAYGVIYQDGSVRLGMAIRTLVRDRATQVTDYFTGGGIVADSVPERELEETEWKAAHLRALLR